MLGGACQPKELRDSASIPQVIEELIKEYPFQPVRTEPFVVPLNIVLCDRRWERSIRSTSAGIKTRFCSLEFVAWRIFPFVAESIFTKFPQRRVCWHVSRMVAHVQASRADFS